MDEFDEWATLHGYIPGFNSYCHAKKAWLESASRADKRARKEIVELLENLPIGSGGQDDVILRAISMIRATIPEE